jgi:hypothetical protein
VFLGDLGTFDPPFPVEILSKKSITFSRWRLCIISWQSRQRDCKFAMSLLLGFWSMWWTVDAAVIRPADVQRSHSGVSVSL